MEHDRRQMILLSGSSLLAGCNSRQENDVPQSTSTASPSKSTSTASPATGTETFEATNSTTTPESGVPTPDHTLTFGDSYVDVGLEITVETPSIKTRYIQNGEEQKLPDGLAFAFTPVMFFNTEQEDRPVDGPIFTLTTGEYTTTETEDLRYTDLGVYVQRGSLDNVPRTGRFDAHGTGLKPDEKLRDIALFPLTVDTQPNEISIIYQSESVSDDRFGDKVVAWKSK